jgi:hypothetical protein
MVMLCWRRSLLRAYVHAVVSNEAQYGGSPVELIEAAAESAVRDDAPPGLANQRGAEEARWLIGREAEEDLLNELVRRRLGEAQRRRRRHGAG